MASIGEKLLAARKAKGLTQSEAAVQCKMDPNTYRDYENDRRPPTLKQIPALSAVLGISEHLLIHEAMLARSGGVQVPAPVEEGEEPLAAEFAEQLSQAIDRSKKKRAMDAGIEEKLRAMRNDPTVIVDLDQAVEDARRRLERKAAERTSGSGNGKSRPKVVPIRPKKS